MNVPSLNRMPSQSPSAGHSAGVAFVSGPRTVRKVLPLWRVTAISTLLAATDRKTPAERLWLRQTRSTNGESDRRSSKLRNIGDHQILKEASEEIHRILIGHTLPAAAASRRIACRHFQGGR